MGLAFIYRVLTPSHLFSTPPHPLSRVSSPEIIRPAWSLHIRSSWDYRGKIAATIVETFPPAHWVISALSDSNLLRYWRMTELWLPVGPSSGTTLILRVLDRKTRLLYFGKLSRSSCIFHTIRRLYGKKLIQLSPSLLILK